MTWQQIETAPKDGTTIFAAHCRLGQRGMIHFNGSEWEMVDGLSNMPMGVGFCPTHWQPLPGPPPFQHSPEWLERARNVLDRRKG